MSAPARGSVRQEPVGDLHDRDGAAEARERLTQLTPDRSAAQDHEPRR
jgi:hypothetical protein